MDQRLSGVGRSLDDLVRAAQSDLPEPSRLAGIEARLLTQLPLGSASGNALVGWTAAAKIAGIAAVVLFGGAWLALHGDPRVPEAPRVVVATLATSPSTTPVEVVEHEPPPAVRTDEVTGAPPEARHPGGAPARASADVDGLELLRLARKSLRDKPGQALSLLDEHARLHPKSALSQEREVLRTMALSALGRASEAERSAAKFSERFPDSAHQRKVREASQQGSPR